jgi:hypothetical protein
MHGMGTEHGSRIRSISSAIFTAPLIRDAMMEGGSFVAAADASACGSRRQAPGSSGGVSLPGPISQQSAVGSKVPAWWSEQRARVVFCAACCSSLCLAGLLLSCNSHGSPRWTRGSLPRPFARFSCGSAAVRCHQRRPRRAGHSCRGTKCLAGPGH